MNDRTYDVTCDRSEDSIVCEFEFKDDRGEANSTVDCHREDGDTVVCEINTTVSGEATAEFTPEPFHRRAMRLGESLYQIENDTVDD